MLKTPNRMSSLVVRAVALLVIAIASYSAFRIVKDFGGLWEGAQESANLNESAGLNKYTSSGQESTAMVRMWPIIALILLGVVVYIAGCFVWKPQNAQNFFNALNKS
tara:strand:+ start:2916 stop:3236 length:321 start_codon:yes stop_codon:yes gene_type:complete